MKQKFTKLIEADEDAFYMSCPETVGEHVAKKLSGYGFKTVVELCCAVGVFAAQLGKEMESVIGVDIDERRIEAAKYNTRLYNVAKKVQFICGDVLDENLLANIKADVAILDPDWSAVGTEKSNHVLSMDDTQPSMRKMIELTKKHITNNIVARIPKYWTFDIIKEINPCSIETVVWNDKPKFKIAYHLDNIKENIESKLDLGKR